MKINKKLVTTMVAILIALFSTQQVVQKSTAKKPASNSYKKEISADFIDLLKATSTVYSVKKVADGDTFSVSNPENPIETVTIRMIGVDTPETVDPRKEVQCFGKEASEFTKSLLTHAKVRLETDASQSIVDKFGRLLAYVTLVRATSSEPIFINKALISEGYAHEYTYDIPYVRQSEFKEAELIAREAKKGLWDPEKCYNP